MILYSSTGSLGSPGIPTWVGGTTTISLRSIQLQPYPFPTLLLLYTVSCSPPFYSLPTVSCSPHPFSTYSLLLSPIYSLPTVSCSSHLCLQSPALPHLLSTALSHLHHKGYIFLSLRRKGALIIPTLPACSTSFSFPLRGTHITDSH